MQIPKVKLLIETSRGYGQSLLRGIARYARLHGPWSFVQEPVFYLKSGKRALQGQECTQVDGIIAHVDNVQLMRELLEEKVPIILKGIGELPAGIPSIQSNDLAIGRMAAEHLLGLGFRHFGYCGYEGMYWSGHRCTGFSERVGEAGYEVDCFESKDVPRHQGSGALPSVLEQWLLSLPKPVGILACNDDCGQEVIRSALRCGLSVPQEVAVVGVDNDEIVCELAEFPLSSIAVANEKAGFDAAALLHSLMKGADPDGQHIVPEPLYAIQRLSTDTLAVEDRAVRQALYFIRDQLPRKFAVEHVVARMQMSRRMAEIRFRKATGHTINEQIIVQRVRLVQQMLVETTLPVELIARRTGFSSAAYLGMKFKAIFGLTPMGYRKKHCF